MMHKAKTFLQMPIKDKLLALEVFLFLALAKFLLLLLPFRIVSRLLGTSSKSEPGSLDFLSSEQHLPLKYIGKHLDIVGKNLPWLSVCLDRAVAGMFLLRRRGLPTNLFLGVNLQKGTGPINAHAWLISSGWSVVGGYGEGYHVLACYVNDRREAPN